MLEPGGALALIVHTVTGRPRPPGPGVPAIPHDEIKALVRKYLGSTQRAGQGTAPRRAHRFEDVLARTRFGVPRQFFAPGIPNLLRDSESVLSGYFPCHPRRRTCSATVVTTSPTRCGRCSLTVPPRAFSGTGR